MGKFFMTFRQRLQMGWGTQSNVDIEDIYHLNVLSVKGLMDVGETTNVLVETYADSSEARAYTPVTPFHKPTTIEMDIAFRGTDRRVNFEKFCKRLTGCLIKYRDDYRNVEVDMVLKAKVEISEDVFIGSNPYIRATFTFQSLSGNASLLNV